MALTKVASDGIEDLAITNAHLHTAANIASSKLADSGASAGSYGSSTAIPSVTVNAKGLVTSISQTSIDTDLVADTSPQLGGDLDVLARKITTSISNGNVAVEPDGSGVFEVRGAGGNDGTLQLNCSAQSHGIKLKSPAHSAAASYTFTFPVDIQNGKYLKTDASGNTSWDSPTEEDFTTTLKNKLDGIAASATNVTNNNQLTNGAGYITATLTNEQVQDIIGAMFSGNTESGITATYQDSDGTIDLSVASQTDQNFTTTLKNKLDAIAANATNVTNNNQLTNGAGYITSASLSGVSDGGNAALLDGVDSTSFARSDQDDTLGGIYQFSNTNRDCFNFSGNATDDNRGVAFNGRIALSADYNDAWLRLNNANEFSNGVFTAGILRADAGFYVGGNQVINGSGQLISSRLTGALPAIDGSNLTGVGGGVESGTKMVFYQANAPTGWTKQTSNNNKALRVVSGSGGGTGGSNNFTTAFNSSRGTSGGSVSNHTLTTAQIPSHRHKVDTYNEFGNQFGNWATQGGYRQAHAGGTRRPPYTSYEGSGNAHNHGFSNPSLNLNVQYIDVIVAQKD